MVSAAFKEDYGEVRGRKPLPLRWLPWENLVLVSPHLTYLLARLFDLFFYFLQNLSPKLVLKIYIV